MPGFKSLFSIPFPGSSGKGIFFWGRKQVIWRNGWTAHSMGNPPEPGGHVLWDGSSVTKKFPPR